MQSARNRKGVKLFLYLVVIVAVSVLAEFVFTTAYSGSKDDPESGIENEAYSVQGVPIPEKVTFAGEPLPLDLFDVKEALDRELLSNAYFHSQTIRLIKLTCPPLHIAINCAARCRSKIKYRAFGFFFITFS